MAHVHFTSNLKRFFPALAPLEVEGQTVQEVLARCEEHFPGLCSYIVDETGALRQHVNIFVNGSSVVDRVGLTDVVTPETNVHILQALSGG